MNGKAFYYEYDSNIIINILFTRQNGIKKDPPLALVSLAISLLKDKTGKLFSLSLSFLHHGLSQCSLPPSSCCDPRLVDLSIYIRITSTLVLVASSYESRESVAPDIVAFQKKNERDNYLS